MSQVNTVRAMLAPLLFASLALAGGFFTSASQAALISAGTPTTSVPTYLTDGTYLFGITVTLGPNQFLLPVEIEGAANLQSWQFDLLFDNAVVEVVDPSDGSAGIYGAEFTPGDAGSLSFIFSSFPFNFLGLVDDVAGSHPGLLGGASGDGALAYVLFGFLPNQANNNPNFRIDNAVVLQVPEPAALSLLALALLLLATQPSMRAKARRIN